MRTVGRRAVSMVGAVVVALLVTVLPAADAGAGAVPSGPALVITKITSQIGVEAGGTVTFEIEVTNTGDTALTGVVVTDLAAPDCATTVGGLAIGRTHRYACSHTTTGADVGSYVNTATADSNETEPVDSAAVSTTVTGGDDPATVGYTCNNPDPFDNTPITAEFDVNLFDDVDPAEPGQVVTWPLDVDQPSLDSLPTQVEVNYIRLTIPRPANLTDLQLNLSNPPGQVANPANNLTTTTVNPTDVVIQTPNNGQKIVGKTDGSLVFPGANGSPVVLPRASLSAKPTDAARGTDIQWKPPTVVINGTVTFIIPITVTVTCTPTDSNVTIVSTRVNPARAALDVDLDSVQAEVGVGDDIDYTIDIENIGNVALTNVAVSDPAAPDCDGPLANLAPGATAHVDCTYPTTSGDIGIRRNTALVTTTETGQVGSNPVGVVVKPPLEVSLDVPDTAVAGTPVPVAVDVSNTGGVPLTGVTLEVAGAPGCDTTIGTIGVSSAEQVPCTADAAAQLEDYAKDGELEIVATAEADGIAPVSTPTSVIAVSLPGSGWTDLAGWYADAADWMDYWDLADGYDGNTFRGGNDITRAALARMVYRLAGEPDTSGFDPDPFPDMPGWAATAIRWVANDPDGDGERSPLMTGVNGEFRPLEPITRAQVLRLLYRFAGEPPTGALDQSPYPDMPPWVADAARWGAADLDGNGPLEPIITGVGGKLVPNDPITRAQTARMVFRVCQWLATQPD